MSAATSSSSERLRSAPATAACTSTESKWRRAASMIDSTPPAWAGLGSGSGFGFGFGFGFRFGFGFGFGFGLGLGFGRPPGGSRGRSRRRCTGRAARPQTAPARARSRRAWMPC
eukprot:scaffold108967_cov72-Phaeocystis_antarctica.AAC.2